MEGISNPASRPDRGAPQARTGYDKNGYQTLAGAGRKTNHLDPKQRELIALVVAVTLRCDGCIVVHTTEAKKFGATEAEIAEALGVAISVNTGAALVYSARVVDATHAVTE